MFNTERRQRSSIREVSHNCVARPSSPVGGLPTSDPGVIRVAGAGELAGTTNASIGSAGAFPMTPENQPECMKNREGTTFWTAAGFGPFQASAIAVLCVQFRSMGFAGRLYSDEVFGRERCRGTSLNLQVAFVLPEASLIVTPSFFSCSGLP